jgi:hypothetical protein
MSVSAHGDRKHCSSITTARRKKHHFHLTKRVRRPFDTTCCARSIGDAKSLAFSNASRAQHFAKFYKCAKPRFHKGFCDVAAWIATAHQATAERAGSAAMALLRRPEGADSPVKKNLGNVRARAPPIPESDANRANRLQVIRGRRRLR